MRESGKKARVGRPGQARRPGRPNDEGGFVVIIVLILIAVLALLGLAMNRNIITDIGIARNQGENTKAFYAAEAAVQYSYNQFYQTLQAAGTVPVGGITYTALVPNQTGCSVNSAKVLAPPPSVQRKINASSLPLSKFNGLFSWVTTYTITATATDNSTTSQNTVSLDVLNTLIPVFQFGVFYNGILEMNPGANLTIPVNGWIHTNSTLFTSTSATETINSNITSAGQIIHSREPGDPQTVGTGNVSIEGANGQYYNLATGSQTVSNGVYSSNNQWPTTVQQWGGTVGASEEGVTALNLPLPTSSGGEYPGSESILNTPKWGSPGQMYSEAAVIITNGTAADAKGNTLSTCYYNANYTTINGSGKKVLNIDPGCTSGANEQSVTTGTVYDYRQSQTADTTDIDVQGFQQSQAGQYLAEATPSSGGTSGVLFVTSTASATGSTFPAVRLVDGATLSSPLTVATDLPSYVQGNYNMNSPVPAAIISDATTVLSNQWSNSYNSSTTLEPQGSSAGRLVNQPYTINADIMTGNSVTTSSGYGGGFENFIRFLEDWGDNGKAQQNFNFGGSLVCMWASQKATAPWQNTGNYYNAPNRSYTFGVFGTNWPPGTPCLVSTTKGTWSHS